MQTCSCPLISQQNSSTFLTGFIFPPPYFILHTYILYIYIFVHTNTLISSIYFVLFIFIYIYIFCPFTYIYTLIYNLTDTLLKFLTFSFQFLNIYFKYIYTNTCYLFVYWFGILYRDAAQIFNFCFSIFCFSHININIYL